MGVGVAGDRHNRITATDAPTAECATVVMVAAAVAAVATTSL